MDPPVAPAAEAHLRFVDVARGLGIVSVVLWHTAGGLVRRDPIAAVDFGSAVDAWDVYIYRAMPLFFFLSGMFVLGSLRRSNREFVESKVRTLAWPYVVWSVISIVAAMFAGSASLYALGLSDLPRLLFDPLLQYWFLYALFVMMIGYVVIFRIAPYTRSIAVAAGVLYVATISVDTGSLLYVVVQIGLFSVFFATGAAYGLRVIGSMSCASRSVLAVTTVAAGAISGIALLVGPVPPLAWLPFVSATAATVAFLALATLIDSTRAGGVFAVLGRHSLRIYVAQILLASATRVALSKVGVDSFWPVFAVSSAIGVFGPLALSLATDRAGFPYLWKWPAAQRPPAQAISRE